MAATIKLPEHLASRLEELAREERSTVDALIDRLMCEHLERYSRPAREKKIVKFPLLSKEEAPVVRSLTGAELDELFADEDFASGR